MKVIVKVMQGTNKGKEFDLTLTPPNDAHYVLCEDDVLTFSVITDVEYPDIHLALHEIFIPPTQIYRPSEFCGSYEYRWEPKRLGRNEYRFESFFHNFCGLAELLIVEKVYTLNDGFDIEVLSQLKPIEILARKINADRISSMLEFLARNDGRDLAALARITRKYSGFKEGDKTLAFTLDRIESYINFFEEVLPKLIHKPIVKLVQKNKIKPYNHHLNISEDSINYIVSSPECIREVDVEEEALFGFEDRYFTVDSILETILVEETNLYENQVVHGFVEVLLHSTNDILRRLSEVKIKNTVDVILGYESLFNKLHQFSIKLNKPCIERCHQFIRRLSKIKHILNDHIKVNQVYTREPHFTHKAKQNLTYQKIFLLMIEWSRFGSPDWSLQNELNSIQDLSKLFEFYLFCVLKEHILNYSRQFNGGLIASPIDGTNDSRFVFQVSKELKGELLYEPNIFHSDVEDAWLRDYRNTEAWKRSDNGFILRKDGKYTKPQRKFRRTPDVVFCLTNGDSDSILIMDAKYMQSQKAFHEAMPECVMKYIHGIHHAKTGKNTSIGLMIVNPDEADITRHYHHDEYTIFGETPVLPAIMTASIDVAKAHKFNSTIQRNIFRFIELMALQLNPNGLGEVKHKASEFYDIEPTSYKDFGLNLVQKNIETKVEENIIDLNQINMNKLESQEGSGDEYEPKTQSESIVTNETTVNVQENEPKFEPEQTTIKPKMPSVVAQKTKGLLSIDLIKFPDLFEKPKNKSRQFISKKHRGF